MIIGDWVDIIKIGSWVDIIIGSWVGSHVGYVGYGVGDGVGDGDGDGVVYGVGDAVVTNSWHWGSDGVFSYTLVNKL